MKRFMFIILLLAMVIFPLNLAAQEPTAGPKPVLAASTTQIADFIRNIVGDQCEVLCVLAPGADPHTYSPTPEDMSLVRRADICFENGLHLEGKNWMSNLAKDASKQVVTCTTGVRSIQIESEGQSVSDPHAWFSLTNVAVYINNITRAVVELDPSNKQHYQARASLYLAQLRVLDAWIKQQVNHIPVEKRLLVTSHDAFNYFCRDYYFNPANNFMSVAPVGWSTGGEVGGGMTPQRRREVISGLKDTGARAVFVETSVNPKLIREIANEAGVAIGGELYSDSMGTAGSAAETYIGMMRENVLMIVGALAGEAK